MRKSEVVLAVLALGWATAGSAQTGIVKWRWNTAPEARGDALLKAVMLSGHNAARAAVGMVPLVWSATLAADAARYAQELASSGRFEHAEQPGGAEEQGENLWSGTRGAFRFDEMLASWSEEGRLFRNAPTPNFASTGNWEDVGHYTQMVWGRTREVGCAVAQGRRDDVLVCRYFPAGNVMGETALGKSPPMRFAMRGR